MDPNFVQQFFSLPKKDRWHFQGLAFCTCRIKLIKVSPMQQLQYGRCKFCSETKPFMRSFKGVLYSFEVIMLVNVKAL